MSVQRIPRRGFTLIELLVTIGIIAILAALLIPAVQSSRNSAQRLSCKNQLHQLGLALHMYHESFECFPAGSYVMGPSFPTQTGWGWGAMILPFADQGALFNRANFRTGTAVGDNMSLINTPVSLWRCPSESAPPHIECTSVDGARYTLASGNYCGSEGVLRSMSNTQLRDILDGTSHTLMLGERIVQSGTDGGLPFTSAWCGQVAFANEYDYRSVPHLLPSAIHPINASQTDPSCFGSHHTGGAHFALCDGSVRFINQSISAGKYEALGTINGGELVEAP